MSKKDIKDIKTKVTVVENMRDYSNDPVFVKKAEKARESLKKHGLPVELKRKKK